MCQPACCSSPCCGPPCCPQPTVVNLKCPTCISPRPQGGQDQCPRPMSWPAPPKIQMCCPSSCPPKERDVCFMTVRPMPPKCCPPKPSCGGSCGGRPSGGSCFVLGFESPPMIYLCPSTFNAWVILLSSTLQLPSNSHGFKGRLFLQFSFLLALV